MRPGRPGSAFPGSSAGHAGRPPAPGDWRACLPPTAGSGERPGPSSVPAAAAARQASHSSDGDSGAGRAGPRGVPHHPDP